MMSVTMRSINGSIRRAVGRSRGFVRRRDLVDLLEPRFDLLIANLQALTTHHSSHSYHMPPINAGLPQNAENRQETRVRRFRQSVWRNLSGLPAPPLPR